MRRSVEERFWGKVQKSDGCWEWQAYRMRLGYGRFGLSSDPQAAHRVAWLLTYGPIPDGLFVLHRCDNPPCVRPEHLYLGDQKRNMQDAVERGRHSPNGRMTADQKADIIASWPAESVISIAARTGFSKSQVYRLLETTHGPLPRHQWRGAKLSPEDMATIRELDAAGVPRRQIARRYGVNPALLTRRLGRREVRREAEAA